MRPAAAAAALALLLGLAAAPAAVPQAPPPVLGAVTTFSHAGGATATVTLGTSAIAGGIEVPTREPGERVALVLSGPSRYAALVSDATTYPPWGGQALQAGTYQVYLVAPPGKLTEVRLHLLGPAGTPAPAMAPWSTDAVPLRSPWEQPGVPPSLVPLRLAAGTLDLPAGAGVVVVEHFRLLGAALELDASAHWLREADAETRCGIASYGATYVPLGTLEVWVRSEWRGTHPDPTVGIDFAAAGPWVAQFHHGHAVGFARAEGDGFGVGATTWEEVWALEPLDMLPPETHPPVEKGACDAVAGRALLR